MRGIELPAVMGIVNVTPDSFSDGGQFLDAGRAVEHGLELAAAGAAVLDVGGESTRPGSQPVPAEEQRRRIVPVIRRLAAEVPERVAISVDTADATVAAEALEAGATVVNDITAGRDPAMMPLVAEAGVGYVFMHMQGTPSTMQVDPHYDDVVAEVGAFLAERREAAMEAGIPAAELMADPGLGFGKTVAHNLALLARLGDIVSAAGVPVLVGPSRKGFIGVAGGAPGAPLPVDEREDGTLATVVWALDHGASMVRVHDVAPAVEAVRLLRAMAAAAPTDPDPAVSWRPPTPAPGFEGDGLMNPMKPMKGKWARGIEPRMFCWVIKDRMAACERPGGYARNHRKVRRLEELIWLREHGFTMIVSLLDSPHNLHAYDELSLPHMQVPLGVAGGDLATLLPEVFGTIADLLDDPEQKIIVHLEEFGDRLCGVLAGYLLYTGLVDTGPIDHLGHRTAHRQADGPARPRDRVRDPGREAPAKPVVLRSGHVITAVLPRGLSCRGQ